jgi:ComF family protein
MHDHESGGALRAKKYRPVSLQGLCRFTCNATSLFMKLAWATLQSIVRFSLPPRCAGCGQIVADDHQLCVDCWQSLEFLTDIGCVLCGYPVTPSEQICAPCLLSPPEHDGVRAAVSYGDIARTIILRFKHGGRIGLAKFIAEAMLRNVTIKDALIIPVPLHRWRIWARGFNQSALIASRLRSLSGNEAPLDCLKRVRRTPVLRGLGVKDRAKVVRGVFAIDPAKRPLLKGRSIYLIDDVYTSGATTNACAKLLKQSGAKEVIVLCWARVVRESTDQD